MEVTFLEEVVICAQSEELLREAVSKTMSKKGVRA